MEAIQVLSDPIVVIVIFSETKYYQKSKIS
jgi:hypothetical protein